jgi:hypothetical protein
VRLKQAAEDFEWGRFRRFSSENQPRYPKHLCEFAKMTSHESPTRKVGTRTTPARSELHQKTGFDNKKGVQIVGPA